MFGIGSKPFIVLLFRQPFGSSIVVEIVYPASFIGSNQREAVDRNRTGKDGFLDSKFCAGSTYMLRAGYINVIVEGFRRNIVPVLRGKIDNNIGTGEGLFQSIRLPDIGVLTKMGIFLAVVFIGDGYGVPRGNKACCKAGTDKPGTANEGDAHS
jgi:hypothetical protein